MVTKEEIEKVAKLMRIELDDHQVHVDRIQKMIGYFDILDKAGVEEEELIVQERTLEHFRDDKHEKYEDQIIKKLKNYKGNYVRSPKLS